MDLSRKKEGFLEVPVKNAVFRALRIVVPFDFLRLRGIMRRPGKRTQVFEKKPLALGRAALTHSRRALHPLGFLLGGWELSPLDIGIIGINREGVGRFPKRCLPLICTDEHRLR